MLSIINSRYHSHFVDENVTFRKLKLDQVYTSSNGWMFTDFRRWAFI